ncbi:hypothetical protein PENTCL1PPCAC_2362 [Pristionchus entomophagus]|uniref:Tudor domain-containing protein n=1 Tax=Pristionchus entomophagus TaxID=358040 RepID=A0AAV5SAB7_9BILA|nr:hypothetical protein PENTCL1PPCAC_2362 [Pristionchus entomophagus]
MTPSLSPGWHVSHHALRELLEGIPDDNKKLETLIMDLDLKSFGLPSLQDKMDKSAGVVKGPIVLQISRMRDCGRPSLGESSPSNLIRVFLTDGHQAVNGISLEKINGLSEEKTPWGTKILLDGEVKVEGQFILLTPSNVTVLGGRVDRLIERWSIEKSAMKGMGRKSGEVTAPKWVSFGRKDNNGDAIKNTKNFKANDVLKRATEKEEEEGEDQFEKARKEKLDAVETAERKFAKVEAPKGGLSEEAKVEQMKEKMKKRGEKEEERREKRGMKGGRRGRRGSDDEPDVPSEFARPSHGITLSSFLGDNVAPPPMAVPVVAPPPMETRGGERGGRGGGMNDRGRGGYGREEINGGGRGGYGNREERGGDGGRGGRSDREEGKGGRDGGGRGGSQSVRDREYGMRDERRDQEVDHGLYGNGRGERREGGFNGQDVRRDGGGRGMERGRGGGGGGRGGGERGGDRGRGGDKIPSLMNEMDFPSVDGLSRGMGGMKIGGGGGGRAGGGMYSDAGRGEGMKQGSRVKAPWDDGNFYPATVCAVVANTMATVRFDGYDQVKTLPIGVLLQ